MMIATLNNDDDEVDDHPEGRERQHDDDDDVDDDDDDDAHLVLPQPKPSRPPNADDGDANDDHPTMPPPPPYRYLRCDELDDAIPLKIQQGTLCWVSLSQGKNRTPRLYKPARVISSTPKEEIDNDNITTSSPPQDPRYHVQYPKGSTYWVRQSNLVPVLDEQHHHHLILVASETTDYRRLATVHTTSKDHFIEIGCDFGILVDSVHAKTALGLDKSESSIAIAKKQYPTREFVLGDIFEKHCNCRLPHPDRKEPLVVAIDINGNRMLPAVLQCIELVLTWSPRLIVVKSRALYAKMKNGGIQQ